MFRIHLIRGQAGRASGRIARLWYDSPAALMAAYLVLGVAADAIANSADIVSKYGGYGWILVLTFLCWRVSRRGWISRGILIYISVVKLLSAVEMGQSWHVQAVAVFAISLVGLMLLLSPAVYARTHPGAVAASLSIRLRPSRWIILSAPLGGTAVAGLTLAVARRWFLSGSGCAIAPVEVLPRHCVGQGRGFPLPVAATVHGHHVVSMVAFVKDCAEWTMFIVVVSYLLWLAFHRRHPPAQGRPAGADLITQPSQ